MSSERSLVDCLLDPYVVAGGFLMRAGMLRHRVTIQRQEIVLGIWSPAT